MSWLCNGLTGMLELDGMFKKVAQKSISYLAEIFDVENITPYKVTIERLSSSQGVTAHHHLT